MSVLGPLPPFDPIARYAVPNYSLLPPHGNLAGNPAGNPARSSSSAAASSSSSAPVVQVRNSLFSPLGDIERATIDVWVAKDQKSDFAPTKTIIAFLEVKDAHNMEAVCRQWRASVEQVYAKPDRVHFQVASYLLFEDSKSHLKQNQIQVAEKVKSNPHQLPQQWVPLLNELADAGVAMKLQLPSVIRRNWISITKSEKGLPDLEREAQIARSEAEEAAKRLALRQGNIEGIRQARDKLLMSNCSRLNPKPPKPDAWKWQLEKKVLREWLSKYPREEAEALEALAKKIEYVSFEDFMLQFSKVAASFRQMYSGQGHLYVLVEPGHSSQWVTELAQESKLFAGLVKEDHVLKIVGDVGRKQAKQFTTFLDQLDTLCKTAQREGILNEVHLPTDILVPDDGSYSGRQLNEHIEAIFETYRKLGYKFPEIYILCPFITKHAFELLKATGNKYADKERKKLHICDNFRFIPTVQESVSEAHAQTLNRLLWSKDEGNDQGARTRGTMIFGHKVPNYASFPEIFTRGGYPGAGKNGKLYPLVPEKVNFSYTKRL